MLLSNSCILLYVTDSVIHNRWLIFLVDIDEFHPLSSWRNKSDKRWIKKDIRFWRWIFNICSKHKVSKFTIEKYRFIIWRRVEVIFNVWVVKLTIVINLSQFDNVNSLGRNLHSSDYLTCCLESLGRSWYEIFT